MSDKDNKEIHPHPTTPQHVYHAHNFIFTYLFLCGLAIMIALIYTWQHKKVTDLQSQVQSQQAQITQLQSENHKLKVVSPTITPSSDYSKGVYFSGTVTTDSCSSSTVPIGDVGCHLIVDSSKYIQVVHGNIAQTRPWGQYNNPTSSSVGKNVSVYAHLLAEDQYTLEGSSSFYVKITN